MKVGFISDVHANLPALNAVLTDLQDVDRIIHAGDMVGYNAFPKKVIRRFQQENINSISGNHDKSIINNSKFDFPDAAEKVLNWTYNELSNKDKEFISQLPSELQLEIDEYTIRVVHGSPNDTEEYVYPTDITLEMVNQLNNKIDVLVWGHTHYPLVTSINNLILLNPGSVGQPRDGDWRASYIIFDTSDERVELRRKEFDIEKVIEKAAAESFPQQIIDLLYHPDQKPNLATKDDNL